MAATRGTPVEPPDVARLARHLAESGNQLDLGRGHKTADLASTGGPGSLSTLIVPLALAVAGFSVPKLGVAGRPAGAIDALGTIPGYKVRLGLDEFEAIIGRCGYAHSLAHEQFAPLDAALYKYRRRVKAVDIPALAIASLLAKKLALGITLVGLDVRVFPGGNFGSTADQARDSARLFISTAEALGIRALCFLHSGLSSWQPGIGRGESLAALRAVVEGGASSWLALHAQKCLLMAKHLTGESAEPGILKQRLADHLEAQGSSWEAFLERTEEVGSAPRTVMLAKADGRAHLDLAMLREALVRANMDTGDPPFLDNAGVTVRALQATSLPKGEPVADLRCVASRIDCERATTEMAAAFSSDRWSPESEEWFEVLHA